jgi:hypothetical protein
MLVAVPGEPGLADVTAEQRELLTRLPSLSHQFGREGCRQNLAVRALWWSAFREAGYVWLTGDADRRIPWTPQLRSYLYGHFR